MRKLFLGVILFLMVRGLSFAAEAGIPMAAPPSLPVVTKMFSLGRVGF
jgi:hypothetical protein